MFMGDNAQEKLDNNIIAQIQQIQDIKNNPIVHPI